MTDIKKENIEMLDVLDENGVFTGILRARAEVHEKGLWHRAAILAIVNSDNKILMQHRSDNVRKFPGKWDLSTACHVLNGEDSLSSIVRETNEEIGVQIGFRAEVRDFRYVTSFRNHLTVGDIIENQFYDLFMLRRDIDSLSDLRFNDAEVSEIQFMTYSEIMYLLQNGQLHPRTEWLEPINKVIYRF